MVVAVTEDIVFVENPGQRHCEEIVAEIVRTEKWTRLKGEFDIWSSTQDYFLFIVAFDSKTNEPVGSISLTMDRSPDGNPEDDLYYIGSFYTKPSHRGIGLGLELFKRCMKKTQGKNVNLNSALVMADFYDKRFGFSHYPVYFNAFAKAYPTAFQLDTPLISDTKILNVDSIDFNSVISYDQTICKRQRTKYLHRWLTGEHATSKVAVDQLGKVIGFVCVRPQIVNRLTVGPFYADNKEIAHDLLSSCLKDVEDFTSYDDLWLRFPEPNEQAMRSVLDSLTDGNYKITRSVKSMFTKKLIEPNPMQIYSVFEAGHSLV